MQIGAVVDQRLDGAGDGELWRWLGLPACGVSELTLQVKMGVARTRYHLTYIPSPSPLVHVTCIVTLFVTITVTITVT